MLPKQVCFTNYSFLLKNIDDEDIVCVGHQEIISKQLDAGTVPLLENEALVCCFCIYINKISKK